MAQKVILVASNDLQSLYVANNVCSAVEYFRKLGGIVGVAGLVICRQRPGSARGVVFLTLEDETSTGNIVVWPDRFEKYRHIVIGARLIHIEGRVQRSGAVVHLVGERFTDCTEQLVTLTTQKGMQTRAHLPKILRSKKQTGRKTPREMAWRGLQ